MDASQALTEFFHRPSVIAGLSALGGFVLSSLVNHLRARVKEVEYTVAHTSLGLSSEDQIFGNVRVTWQENEVVNLYLSTLTLTNSTTEDLRDFTFKIFTGDETLMLSQRTEIVGTSYILPFSPQFAERLRVNEGKVPTAAQFEEHRHTREYLVASLNKGQSAKIQVLTTVPGGQTGPSVWADCLHPGVRTRHVPLEPSTWGVANRFAQPLGITAAVLVTVAASYSLSRTALVATIACVAGLCATLIGALIVRAYRIVKRVVIR